MHPYRIDIITQYDQHTGMDDHGRQRKIVYPVKQQMNIIGCQDLTKNQGQRPCQNKTQGNRFVDYQSREEVLSLVNSR